MSKTLDEYRDMTEEYVEAKQVLQGISDITASVARCLTTEPYRMTFSGSGMDLPLDPDFAGKPLVCASEQWPTTQMMSEAVTRLYRAEQSLRAAYEKLSPGEKHLVEPPPASK
ncbi:hypothetical protein DEALK_01600 [Dehalogenimonas alkenigignens]|uniref:Uncharacterized protein n=1 Tax=Dehalogenimonas alkenigignens TaxID=1217799 RepID=A0A0W0GL09_9CHLR|nr:hypothetical protein [Dehalogenimonas alkenigignens]KTB49248.1 hypothetical protein DEALK_01600 [Dehalogenimonas alkenigignens]